MGVVNNRIDIDALEKYSGGGGGGGGEYAPLKIIDKNDISHSADAYTEIPYTLPDDITKYHFAIISGRMLGDDYDFGIIVPISIFVDNKRIGAIEMASTTASIRSVALNATTNSLRITTGYEVTAGRITVHLI